MKELRRQVEELDEALLGILKKRLNVAHKIGKVKAVLRSPVVDKEQEGVVLRRVGEIAGRLGLDVKGVKRLFREVIKMSREVQRVKVAFLGPPGTNSQEAALKFFGDRADLIPCSTIANVFRQVEAGAVDFGVIPVESSIEGSVTASLDSFLSSSVRICGEVEVLVRHNLIVHPSARLEDIKVIISHPQALAQCRKFIEERFPNAILKEVDSTAKAVETLTHSRDVAAIGSELAAEIYGMKVEVRDIQDVPTAFTRFCVIGEEDCPPTGNDKTSIIFSAENVPGALYRALEPFAKRNINLTRVESRPTKKRPWDYVFFLDFEGHRQDPACKEALEELQNRANFLKILGSYSKWPCEGG